MLERGHGPQCGGDPTREVVPGETEVLQHRQAKQSVELDLPGEPEAVEDYAGDVGAGAVAGDPGPRAGALVRPGLVP